MERYEAALEDTRISLSSNGVMKYIVDSDCPVNLFHLWSIRWAAHGVRMTEQVASWIERAGRRTKAMGLHDLGRNLQAHSHAEYGHEKLLAADARTLVNLWNQDAKEPLNAEQLIASSPLYSARKYVELHEETIGGKHPYCQVAIEYEIERISVVLGPSLLARYQQTFKEGGYSFIAEHVELDQGHTAFNQRQLQKILESEDDTLVPLVEAGRLALQRYAMFPAECLQLAKQDLIRELSA